MTQNNTYRRCQEMPQVIKNACEQLCVEGSGARNSVQLLARSSSKPPMKLGFANKTSSMSREVNWSWSRSSLCEIAALHAVFLRKTFAGGQ
jgi:hypothetical protein